MAESQTKAAAKTVVAEISSWLALIIGLAFLVLMMAAILDAFGIRQGFVKILNPTEFAYLAGAWWLIRK